MWLALKDRHYQRLNWNEGDAEAEKKKAYLKSEARTFPGRDETLGGAGMRVKGPDRGTPPGVAVGRGLCQ